MKSLLTMSLLALLATSATGEIINIGRSDVQLTVPANYSKDSPAPLLVALHGYTSNSKQVGGYLQFAKFVDEYGFLLLLPDGTKENSPKKSPFWNATDACCNLHDSDVDDSGYLRDLIQEVKKRYAVDGNQVYFFGHSNGGFMAHRMAYDYPDVIAAIVSLAGASLPEMSGPTPKRPVGILQIHGTDDSIIDYEGGEIKEVPYPSANETVEKWAVRNGIALEKKQLRKKLDLDRRLEGRETTITQFGKRGTVELWTIHGGRHLPALSKDFTRHVIEWLLAHPKDSE